MHSLIDANMVETIRSTGNTSDNMPAERNVKILMLPEFIDMLQEK
jgi:hypothetical protein